MILTTTLTSKLRRPPKKFSQPTTVFRMKMSWATILVLISVIHGGITMPASNNKEDERNGDPLECDNKIVMWEEKEGSGNGKKVDAVKSSKGFLTFITVDVIKKWGWGKWQGEDIVKSLKSLRRYVELIFNAAKDCLEPADIQKAEGIMKEIDNRLEN